jgi:diaminopimelate epimerase
MRFTKMHGLGNDFVVLDARDQPVVDPAAVAVAVCDRRRGVGADGILLIEPAPQTDADLRFRNINADGSEAEMCGNGIRCVHKYVLERGGASGASPGSRLRWLTGAGMVTTETAAGSEGQVERVRVDMGPPRLEATAIPVLWQGRERVVDEPMALEGSVLRLTCVSMGNPHAVVFDRLQAFPLERLGPALEHHLAFPQRVNLEVVEALAPDHVRVRVWERGVGETLACGTGACAAAVATHLVRDGHFPMQVDLAGGSLAIDWDSRGSVYLTGPATQVFEGDWPL